MNAEPSELMYLERTKSLTSAVRKSYYNSGNVTNNMYCKKGVDTSCSNCSKEPNWGKSQTFFYIFVHVSHVRFAKESFMWFGSFTVIQSNPVITFGFGIDRTRCECWGLGYKLKSDSLLFTLLFVFDPLCMHYYRHLLFMVNNNRGCICVRQTKIVDK